MNKQQNIKYPKVSVIVTVYNLDLIVSKCIDSVLNQTYKNIEIIAVNDASTDGSAKTLDNYKNKGVKVIHHDINKGPGVARMSGINVATGEYIMTIDGDDYISNDFIESLVNNAIETGADIVNGGITKIYIDNEYIEEVLKIKPNIITGVKKVCHNMGPHKFLTNCIIRKSLYDKVPYCTRKFHEDAATVLRLYYYANMISYIDNSGYYYLQHGNNNFHKQDSWFFNIHLACSIKDNIDFFMDKGKEYAQLVETYKKTLKDIIKKLKQLKTITPPEEIDKYKNELNNLTIYILDMI